MFIVPARRLTLDDWYPFIASFPFPTRPKPTLVVLHHTWKPKVEDWRGARIIEAIRRYYERLGWRAGPHLFCAPDGVWHFSDLSRPGIHAGRGNGSNALGWYSVGVEMVGDYDHALPSGDVWRHTLATLDGLMTRLNLNDDALRFHRDYSSKSCPGRAVTKPWVLAELKRYRNERHTRV